ELAEPGFAGFHNVISVSRSAALIDSLFLAQQAHGFDFKSSGTLVPLRGDSEPSMFPNRSVFDFVVLEQSSNGCAVPTDLQQTITSCQCNDLLHKGQYLTCPIGGVYRNGVLYHRDVNGVLYHRDVNGVLYHRDVNGVLYHRDVPRSPWSTLHSQFTYWTYRGS